MAFGVGEHTIGLFADIADKTLTVEWLESETVEHEVIVCGIGKSQEHLGVFTDSVHKFLILHEIGESSECLEAADIGDDTFYRIVEKGFFQVSCTGFGMSQNIVGPSESVFCEAYVKSECIYSLHTDVYLLYTADISENTVGQANYGNFVAFSEWSWFYHFAPPFTAIG